MEITKTCTKCKKEKLLSLFKINKNLKSGVDASCKLCNSKQTKLYFNTEKGKEKKETWLINNRTNILESHRVYRKNNLEKILKREQIWKENNIEIIKIKSNKHRIKSKESLTDAYICKTLKDIIGNNNFPKIKNNLIPQELIELKRIQIKTFRLCQQLQN